MLISRKISIAACLLLLSTASSHAQEEERSVEVVHWWTSGGEATALKALKDDVTRRGITWKDSAVAGGGGEKADAELRARMAAGTPPDAMQMQGFNIAKYAQDGLLGNIDAIAIKEDWDFLVPKPLQRFSKYKDHWVAIPVNIHRTNWIWANKKIFDELNLKPPRTFDELTGMADKIRAAGYIPLAHGGQPWQEATLFDSAVMSAGGASFYTKALVELDPQALGSKTMEKAFEQMRKLSTMVDPKFPGRDWNSATSMVINKKAAMQIMGDWAKGEFTKEDKKPNIDYLCFQYPGTAGTFIFNADQFGILKVSPKQATAQTVLGSAIMSRSFQEKFNIAKGSIPARTDVTMDEFDSCGRKSMIDLKQANRKGTMVGSFAHGHAMPDAAKAAVTDVVSKFFNSRQTPAEAVKLLVAAAARKK